MSQNFQLNKISQYRTELMGLGTLLILMCHATVSGVNTPPSISYILSLGNLGVEIFFFLSGIGLVYSLKKYSGPLAEWYKKRLIRILIPYLFIAIPWFTLHAYIHDESFIQIMINISTLNYWLHHEGAWFIAILIPLYFLTPVLYRIIQSKYWFIIIQIIVITSLCTLIPSKGVAYNILWALHRLPCFFIGMLTAKFIMNNCLVRLYVLLISCILAMIILRCIDPLIGWHWPIIFIWIPLVCKILDRIPLLKNWAAYLGMISLESYILNLGLKDLFPIMTCDENGYIRYSCIILIGLILAKLVNNITKRSLAFNYFRA